MKHSYLHQPALAISSARFIKVEIFFQSIKRSNLQRNYVCPAKVLPKVWATVFWWRSCRNV